jgi:hypothetical protein
MQEVAVTVIEQLGTPKAEAKPESKPASETN